MSDITSDVLGLSFDSAGSPSIKLKLPKQLYGSHPLGWGYGWYPNDNHAAIVAKDSSASNTDIFMNALREGTSFRSTLFLCKVKGSATGYTHRETQPFTRTYAGRDWLFLHNGDLDRAKLRTLVVGQSRFLDPLGKTDSEMALLYLLGRIQEQDATKISDLEPEMILGWMQELDALGSADLLLSDGSSLVCFYGTHSDRALYWSRIQPTQGNERYYSSESIALRLDDPRDTTRTVFAVTSTVFHDGEWTAMAPGELVIARRGKLIWSSFKQVQDSKPKKTKKKEPASSTSEASTSNPPTAEPICHGAPEPENNNYDTAPSGIHHSILNPRAMTHTPDGAPLAYRVYDITHRTDYTYAAPIEHSTHIFRLQPVEDSTQEVVQSHLTVSVNGEETRYEDVFGNESIHYSISRPYTQLTITSESRVKVYATPPDDHSLSQRRSSIPLVWMPWQRQMMMPYLLPMELPETQLRELTDYAMSFVERNDYHLTETLEDMNRTIYREFQYVQGSTSLGTTPYDVFLSRRGVCQDFANLFICLAQLLSVPARYRMGYIYTGADYDNKIQSEASHAWVEIYLPYLGWRGFDPTNGVMVAQDHIRVACGRHYLDATPTSGTIFRGGGEERLNVSVKVTQLETAQP